MPGLDRLKPAVTLMLAASVGCASRGATPRPFPVPRGAERGSGPVSPAPVVAVAPSPLAAALVETALALRGVPYRDGGADPSGFDCSGFVWYVFSRQGLAVPRTVSDLFLSGVPVEPGTIAPGDLIFFTTTAPGPSHVAIAVGTGQFVHAPSSRGVVRVEPLSSRYWIARYLGARRLDPVTGAPAPMPRGVVPYR